MEKVMTVFSTPRPFDKHTPRFALSDEARAAQDLIREECKKNGTSGLAKIRDFRDQHPDLTYEEALMGLLEEMAES